MGWEMWDRDKRRESLMSVPARRSGQFLLPDLTDWFESFPTFGWRHMLEPQGIRIEDYLEEDRYVVRAEIPGIDPDKDVEITVSDGVLAIKAERSEEKKDKHRSEFRYGSLIRTIRLPMTADEEKVTAKYGDGILTVTAPLNEVKKPARRAPADGGWATAGRRLSGPTVEGAAVNRPRVISSAGHWGNAASAAPRWSPSWLLPGTPDVFWVISMPPVGAPRSSWASAAPSIQTMAPASILVVSPLPVSSNGTPTARSSRPIPSLKSPMTSANPKASPGSLP
jgi:HSP20 family molecular chaperone IbpA